MTDMLDHENFREQIGDYLADGLTTAEKAEFESHARNCSECGLELKSLQDLDHEMMTIFEPLAAPSVMEDRIAERLRMTMPKRRWISPMMRKSAVAAAAVAVVGGIGWAGRSYLVDGQPPTLAINVAANKVARQLSQLGRNDLVYSNESKGGYGRARVAAASTADPQIAQTAVHHDEAGQSMLYGDRPTEFQPNYSVGVQRDNIYARRELVQQGQSRPELKPAAASSYDANDSVLLPVIDGPTPPTAFKPADQYAFKDKADAREKTGTALGLPALAAADRDTQTLSDAGNALAQSDNRPSTQPAGVGAKIIREGTIEFEVDSFDNSFVTIQKVVGEEGGFVAAVDSDKMTNGKVRGTITLRVPPQNLDTMVMKLRSLGDLKTQRLGSTDISKQFTDLEGQLRAARAMETRLLDLIKNANGKVKDLLEAENQLGEWRQKIESVQGQLNFFSNRVSLATLTIIAAERNVNTPASATRHEQITAGLETAEVEHSRAEILKVIDAAKGRIIESSLQQLEAGQLSAKVVADVPSDATGPIADRLHQLGNVTRYDAQRSETVGEGDPTTLQTREVKDQPTRLIFSLYNVANVAPRTTTNLSMVSDDVEAAYRTMLKRVNEASGRLITSNLSHNGPRSVGELRFEIKTADADAVLNDLRSAGQVIALTATENPDSANVTTSKQGFVVSLSAAEQLAPKQTRSVSIQTVDVGGTQQRLLKAIEANGAKIITSALTNADADRSSATLTTDVLMTKLDALLAAAGPNAKTVELRDDPQTPAGPLARARVTFVIAAEPPLLSDHQGIWGSIRSGLATSAGGLLWSLQVLTIGVCLIAPWAMVVWTIAWFWKRRRRAPSV